MLPVLSNPDRIVLGTFIASVVFVLARSAALYAKGKFTLADRMGPPTWDFTKSWASNITVVGAFLGTLVGASKTVLTGTSDSDVTRIAGLNLLWVLLVTVAPLVFNAIRFSEDTHTAANTTIRTSEGYVWTFLLATLLTLWGVWGELATLTGLISNLSSSGAVTACVKELFGLVLYAAIALVLFYAWTSVADTIAEQRDTAGRQKTLKAQMHGLHQQAKLLDQVPLEAELKPRHPSWAIL